MSAAAAASAALTANVTNVKYKYNSAAYSPDNGIVTVADVSTGTLMRHLKTESEALYMRRLSTCSTACEALDGAHEDEITPLAAMRLQCTHMDCRGAGCRVMCDMPLHDVSFT